MTEVLQGADRLRARLNAVATVAGPNSELFRRWQLEAIREAKIRVPRKTSNLGRSIQPRMVGPTSAEIVASANYAAHVEFGTRPHEILPRVKKALRFAATASGARLSGSPRVGAAVVFAKRVMHPGTRPKPYLRPAAEAALRKVGGQGGIIVEKWNGAA